MPSKIKSKQAFKQRRPGFYTATELGDWLGVSRNSVPEIAERFGLKRSEGNYPEADVWRKILGIDPRHEADRELLRRPLAASEWVARKTGTPPSTLRSKVKQGTFEYPLGVQLGEASDDRGAPRSRRWIPCIIDALSDGRQPPDFREVRPLGVASTPAEEAQTGPENSPANNAFARIASSNDDDAQHCSE